MSTIVIPWLRKSEKRFHWVTVFLRFYLSINNPYKYEIILRWIIKENIWVLAVVFSNIILYPIRNYVIGTKHQVNLSFLVNTVNILWPLIGHLLPRLQLEYRAFKVHSSGCHGAKPKCNFYKLNMFSTTI